MAATPPVCDFGWQAVDGILPSVHGNEHQISELAGPGGLVVAFICNHCPYVKAVIDRIVQDARDLAPLGVGFVAICSNDAEAYPDDSFARMKEFAMQHGFPFPYLHDEDQSIARAYGAACTPDFFGFNADLKLQYRGRLDAARLDKPGPDTRRDLYEAMVMVARTGEGPAEQVPSMGCSIKWKAAA
ncbi:MAG: thioredoxin family protein [Rhizobiaceae bacterium]|nr:thioredoxin family protein [Rhizobiaceae bacterium]